MCKLCQINKQKYYSFTLLCQDLNDWKWSGYAVSAKNWNWGQCTKLRTYLAKLQYRNWNHRQQRGVWMVLNVCTVKMIDDYKIKRAQIGANIRKKSLR